MTTEWAARLAAQDLGDSAGHVWRIHVDDSTLTEDPGLELDDGERATAARFVHDADRRRFRGTHIAARRILAVYLGVDAGKIEFRRNDYGKPSVVGDAVALDFSLSHSGRWAVVAVARGPIGVDVERRRELAHLRQMADRWCTPGERQVIESLSGADRLQAFFKCWTAKEAILKAVGCGLHADANQIEVFSDPACLVGRIATPQSIDSSPWLVRWFDVDANHSGAAATRPDVAQLAFGNWSISSFTL